MSNATTGEAREIREIIVRGRGSLDIHADGVLRSTEGMTVQEKGRYGLKVTLGPVGLADVLMNAASGERVSYGAPRTSQAPLPTCLVDVFPPNIAIRNWACGTMRLNVDGHDVTALVRDHLATLGVHVSRQEYRPSAPVALHSLAFHDDVRVRVDRRSLRKHAELHGWDRAACRVVGTAGTIGEGESIDATLHADSCLEGACTPVDCLRLSAHKNARCVGFAVRRWMWYFLGDTAEFRVSTREGCAIDLASRADPNAALHRRRSDATTEVAHETLPSPESSAPPTTTEPAAPADAPAPPPGNARGTALVAPKLEAPLPQPKARPKSSKRAATQTVRAAPASSAPALKRLKRVKDE